MMNTDRQVLLLSSRHESAPFVRFLKRLPVQPLLGGSLSECRRLLRENTPLLLVCDTRLEDGTYQDVLRVAKARNPQMPVVVSGVQDWNEYLDALRLGAFDCIASPDHLHEAARILRQALQESWGRHEEQMGGSLAAHER